MTLFSCNSSEECDNSIFPFQTLYQTILNSPDFEERFWMDAQVHEYSFIMHQDGYICSIGYQSIYPNSIYRISILDKNNIEIFTQEMSFDSTNTDYQNVGEITINVNEEYILRRMIINPKSYKEITGRLIYIDGQYGIAPLNFPYVSDMITISSTKFYDAYHDSIPLDSSNEPIDRLIPFIDFGFVPN